LEALAMMLERLEMQLGIESGGVFHPIFAGSSFVSWFSVSSVVLGQDENPEMKPDGCGRSRPKLD
jgi:hypothetical protein